MRLAVALFCQSMFQWSTDNCVGPRRVYCFEL